MNVGIIGYGAHGQVRRDVVQGLDGMTLAGTLDAVPDFAAVLGGQAVGMDALYALLRAADAVLIGVPTAAHYQVAQAATKRGVHVFIEWPPATSLREAEAIAKFAEEAGVEAGISRPLRYHPVISTLPPTWQAQLIVVQRSIPTDTPPGWPGHLADAVDLCCTLARSHSVQRVDAASVRGEAAWPEAVAFGLRYHNGAYAQVNLRRRAAPAAGTLYAGGGGLQVEVDLEAGTEPDAAPARLLAAETRAFLQALAAGRPAPVPMLDGLNTMRLVERLMKHLR